MLKKTLPLSVALLLSVGALTACDKKEDVAPTTATTETTAVTSSTAETTNSHTNSSEHTHDHADHTHDHDHDHSNGTPYDCDNGSHIHIDIHNHEGEKEAHVIRDDIAYDLPLNAEKQQYISPTDGFNDGQGMVMMLEGDNAIFTTLEGNAITTCKKGN